jgi:hypothetical protein
LHCQRSLAPETLNSSQKENSHMRAHSVLGFVFGGIALVALAAAPVSAQMDHSQMHGGQGMQGMQDHSAMMKSTSGAAKK